MITQKSVQEILDTARVEDVIQDFVNLRRRGVNLIGNCPFHHEKTPSFIVSPAKNIYKCFGCGRAGNAVQFLMDHEHFTFPEALRYLAKKYNLEVEEIVPSAEQEEAQQYHESLFIVNQYAQQFFQDQLFDTPTGKSVGLSYFKERGFLEDTVRKFGLGFAPDQKDVFTSKAVSEGYNIELLRKLGLTTQFDRDFFRNRVMFTIHNLSGKPVAFAGRIMIKDAKAPKYINSPETDIYSKSKVLYGAFFAKQAIRKADECILVEGYTDVISLHQSGIENVVASSGTSLTVDQIRLIKRYTPNVKVLFDGDSAGIKAALRGIDMLLEQDVNVRIVLLPDGEDPDSYLRKVGITAFQTYLQQAGKDFILFKADLLLKEAGNEPIKRTELLKDIIESISKIPDPLKRAMYVKECARLFEVDESILVQESNKLLTKSMARSRQQQEAQQPDRGQPAGDDSGIAVSPSSSQARPSIGHEFREIDLIRVLINYGGEWYDEEEKISVAAFVLQNIEDVMDEFDHALYRRVAEECQRLIAAQQPVNQAVFLSHSDEEIRRLAMNLATSPYEYSGNWADRWEIFLSQKMPDDNFVKDSEQALRLFRFHKILRLCEKTQRQIEQLQSQQLWDQAIAHLKVKLRLDSVKRELAGQLGIVVAK